MGTCGTPSGPSRVPDHSRGKNRFPNTLGFRLALSKKVAMPKILYSRHNEVFLAMLRGLRMTRRLRQADLANRLGRGQGLVSKVERGERRLDVIELRDWLAALDADFVGFVSSLDAQLRLHATTDPQMTRRRGSTRASM
jgi:hypothetical protein